jgi:hypothetical protein
MRFFLWMPGSYVPGWTLSSTSADIKKNLETLFKELSLGKKDFLPTF